MRSNARFPLAFTGQGVGHAADFLLALKTRNHHLDGQRREPGVACGGWQPGLRVSRS